MTGSVETDGRAPANMPFAAEMRAVGGGSAEAACGTRAGIVDPSTVPGSGTRADAEQTLSLAGNDLAALQRRAEAAHQAAWARAFNGPGSTWLARDLRKVKAVVADWLNPKAHGQPKRIEAAMVLLDAERRWSSVQATPTHPMDLLAAHAVPVVKPAAPVTPALIIARLAARGVTLALSEAGRIVAMPAGMLNDTDRAQIAGAREGLARALASAEVVA